jgi:hypothetical protein
MGQEAEENWVSAEYASMSRCHASVADVALCTGHTEMCRPDCTRRATVSESLDDDQISR